MSDNKSNGLGFTTVLFLIFMTLKLANFIDWSWWWVTSPLWMPIALVLGAVAITTIAAYLSYLMNK